MMGKNWYYMQKGNIKIIPWVIQKSSFNQIYWYIFDIQQILLWNGESSFDIFGGHRTNWNPWIPDMGKHLLCLFVSTFLWSTVSTLTTVTHGDDFSLNVIRHNLCIPTIPAKIATIFSEKFKLDHPQALFFRTSGKSHSHAGLAWLKPHSTSPDRFGNIIAILGYVLTRSSFPASLWPVQICKASL